MVEWLHSLNIVEGCMIFFGIPFTIIMLAVIISRELGRRVFCIFAIIGFWAMLVFVELMATGGI